MVEAERSNSLRLHQKILDIFVENFFIQTARFGISSRVGVHIIKAERLVYHHGEAVYLYLLRFDDMQLFELMICSLTTDDIQVASNLMKKQASTYEKRTPRRNATFCQPPAKMQVAMTLRSVAPFPTNLLLRKSFAGALKTCGVLCAYFTRTSPPQKRHPLWAPFFVAKVKEGVELRGSRRLKKRFVILKVGDQTQQC